MSENPGLRIVGFAGSLRRGSYNRGLLAAARGLVPPGMTLEVIEIGDLPFYNADVEAEGDPLSVVKFKSALEEADGLLIATPEHNSGIPALVTNAIDWGSRLPARAPLTGKPVALMGASPARSAPRGASSTGARSWARCMPACCRHPSCWSRARMRSSTVSIG